VAGFDAAAVDVDRGRALARSEAVGMTALHAATLEPDAAQAERLQRVTRVTLLEVELVGLALRDLAGRLERLERRMEAQLRHGGDLVPEISPPALRTHRGGVELGGRP
jgi:hypothetical protein